MLFEGVWLKPEVQVTALCKARCHMYERLLQSHEGCLRRFSARLSAANAEIETFNGASIDDLNMTQLEILHHSSLTVSALAVDGTRVIRDMTSSEVDKSQTTSHVRDLA